MFSFPGPNLNVTSPRGETITNAQLVTVEGHASGVSSIDSVTINNESTSLQPISGAPSNQVSFNHDLSLSEGKNLISVTATDSTGAQATDQIIVSVDQWLPAVSIDTPADGERFLTTDFSVPIKIEASDRGYGYDLNVYLDGRLIHSAEGQGNSTHSELLSYNDGLRLLPLGEHVITATVTDRAGNSTSTNSTIYVDTYQPPPVFSGLEDKVVEASSADGAVVNFEVTAISQCDPNHAPVIFPSPVPTPQSNTTMASGNVNKTFQWTAVSSPDGHPVQYLVQLSNTLDFAAISFNSAWQETTSWTQSLPVGNWYWRVTARDMVETAHQSDPAVGNSFVILHDGSSTSTNFNILHHTDCTYSGGVYLNAGPDIWVGTFDGSDVDRSFLMFDTSSLGAGATVESAKLNLYYHNRDYVESASITEVHESTWELPGAYNGYVGNLLDSQAIPVSKQFGEVTFNIRPDYVKAAGITKFALVAANEDFDALYNSAPGYARTNSFLEVTFSNKTPIWAPPILTPQGNSISHGESVDTTFLWDTAPSMDGDPVEYLVEISKTASFTTIDYSSPWQAEGLWEQPLPIGIWYWRVTARDSAHTAIVSNTAASSFIITYQPDTSLPVVPSVNCTPNSGETFSIGLTTVNCTAMDACNQKAVGSFTIAVQDTTPPELMLPADMVIEADSLEGAPVDFGSDVTATDNVDPVPVITCMPASGSRFPVGDSIVSCTATDFEGNNTTDFFWVKVEETTPPILTIPADVYYEATGPRTIVDVGQATATHHLPVTISNNAPGDFAVGTTVVTWTATAANGKSVSSMQNVTVTDTTAPVVTAPADITIEAAAKDSPIDIGIAVASDTVGVISLINDAPATFSVGSTLVTWTAIDAVGNIGMALQTVFVSDLTPPTLDGLANQSLEATSPAGAIANFTITADDAVDQFPTINCSADSGSIFPIGETTISCTATDAYNNEASDTFTIKVFDTTPPILHAPADITVLLNTPIGSPEVQAFLGGATATDIVDETVSISSKFIETVNVMNGATHELSTVGEKQVAFTAVDDLGNQTTLTAIIHVIYGCGDEFMEPVSLLKPFKQGSTVPVKIGFCDAEGKAVTSAIVKMSLHFVSNDVPEEEPILIQEVGSGDSDNLFKVTGEQYHYNLRTKSLVEGVYQIRAMLDDGTLRSVPLELK